MFLIYAITKKATKNDEGKGEMRVRNQPTLIARA